MGFLEFQSFLQFCIYSLFLQTRAAIALKIEANEFLNCTFHLVNSDPTWSSLTMGFLDELLDKNPHVSTITHLLSPNETKPAEEAETIRITHSYYFHELCSIIVYVEITENYDRGLEALFGSRVYDRRNTVILIQSINERRARGVLGSLDHSDAMEVDFYVMYMSQDASHVEEVYAFCNACFCEEGESCKEKSTVHPYPNASVDYHHENCGPTSVLKRCFRRIYSTVYKRSCTAFRESIH